MNGEGSRPSVYDAIVVGGGPAGLSAALVLGRCRRRVLLFDSGRYRNARSHALHGFLTRDGILPGDLLRLAREELARYDVEIRFATVRSACPTPDGFEVESDDGGVWASRKLVLATGVVDRLPPVEGAEALLGEGLYHCPYCDGWEVRDEPLAVYGRGHAGTELSLALLGWSADVVLCTDGRASLRPHDRARLARHGVRVIATRIARLEGGGGHLARVVFADGTSLERRAMFFTTGQEQHSALPDRLGCLRTHGGAVHTNRFEESSVPGVFVIGDASRDPQLAIVAAAEGAKAAFAVNKALQAIEVSTTPLVVDGEHVATPPPVHGEDFVTPREPLARDGGVRLDPPGASP